MTLVLRDYQVKALDDLRRAWSELRREGVQAPRLLLVSRTATGKSVIAAEFLRAVVAKGRRALFVVRDRVLLDQTSGHLDRVGVTDHGVIAAGHKRIRPGAAVQICSAQTLTAREAHPEADVLMFDEAHGILCESSKAIADAYPEATILGLTATPVRGDGKPLGVPYGVFQRLIQVEVTFAQLVKQGALVDVDVIAPVGAARQHLAAHPIEALEQYGRGRRVVVFLRSIAQAEELAEQALARGFRAASVHGESEDREDVLERIGLPGDDPQALDVLTNCDLLKQGWDCWRVDTIVLARGCSSFSQYMQIAGRALRPVPPALREFETKGRALIVDLRGAVHKHGHPADDVEFALEGKPVKSKDKQQLTQCKACGAVYRRKPACPLCGFQPEPKPIRSRVERAQLGNVKRRLDMNAAERAAADEAKQRAYFDELQRLAKLKSYKAGWVAYRFKAKFGRWPRFAREA